MIHCGLYAQDAEVVSAHMMSPGDVYARDAGRELDRVREFCADASQCEPDRDFEDVAVHWPTDRLGSMGDSICLVAYLHMHKPRRWSAERRYAVSDMAGLTGRSSGRPLCYLETNRRE